MESDWFSVLDRIEDFKLSSTTSYTAWQDWFKQFKIVLKVTSFDALPNSKKVALLMAKCTDLKYAWAALSIDEDTIDFDELVSKLNHYFHTVCARNVFFKRRQLKSEPFEEFANALKALSCPCRFQDRNIVRDAFVLNMDPAHAHVATQILISDDDPSLEDAVARAKFLSGEHQLDIASSFEPMIDQPSGVDSKIALSIRMPLITPGTHEVEIIYVGQSGMVFVVPTNMKEQRRNFLVEYQRLMSLITERAITPHQGLSCSALVNGEWYRVRVIFVEGKKAKVESIDFGWTKFLAPSVFRNTPLDCLVVAPLIWTVNFREPMPQQIKPGATVEISVTQVDNDWMATLQTGMREQRQNALHRPFPSSNNAQSRPAAPEKLSSGRSTGQLDRPVANSRGSRSKFTEVEPLSISLGTSQSMADLGLSDREGHRNGNVPKKRLGDSFTRNQENGRYGTSDQGYLSDRNVNNDWYQDGNHANQPRNDHPYDRQSGFNRTSAGRDHTRNNPLNKRPSQSQGDFCQIPFDSDSGSASTLVSQPPRTGDNPYGRQSHSKGGSFDRNQENSGYRDRGDGFPDEKLKNDRFQNSNRNQPRYGNHPYDQNGLNRNSAERDPTRTNQPFRGRGDYNQNPSDSDFDSVSTVSQPLRAGDNRYDRQSHSKGGPFNRNQGNNGNGRDRGDFSDQKFKTDHRFQNGNRSNQTRNGSNSAERDLPPPNASNSQPFRGQGECNQRTNAQLSDNDDTDPPVRKDLRARREKPSNPTSKPGFTPRQVELNQARGGNVPRHVPLEEPAYCPQPPIPLNKFTKLTIAYKSEDGLVHCTTEQDSIAVCELCNELLHVDTSRLSNPSKGMWCLGFKEGACYRAEIIAVNSTGEKVKVKFLDFGDEAKLLSSEVMVLPEKYCQTPPLAFAIKVPDGVVVGEEGEDIWAKLVGEYSEGVWAAEVDQKSAPKRPNPPGSAPKSPTPPRSAVESPTPPRRPQLPPIPQNRFSKAVVTHTGPEGDFVVAAEVLDELQKLQMKIIETQKTPIPGPPVRGELYIAPFDGEFYRAKVLAADAGQCSVCFIDYGNEGEVNISELYQLPQPLKEDPPYAFRITLEPDSPVTLTPSEPIHIAPVALEPNGAWLVQLRGERTNPDFALPDDDSITFARQ